MSATSLEGLVKELNKNNMWIPLLASIGVGAATYYAVSKNNQGINSALQQVLPVVSHMSGNGNNTNNTGQLGQHGMS